MSEVVIVSARESSPDRSITARDYIIGNNAAVPEVTRVVLDDAIAATPLARDVSLLARARGHGIADTVPSTGRAPIVRPRTAKRPVVALLHDPKDPFCASTSATLYRAREIFADRGLGSVMRTPDGPRVEADALFIRACTSPDNEAARWAAASAALGLPTIDDPGSILRCGNKLFLAEAFRSAGVPTPPSRLVLDDEDLREAFRLLGSPIVLKTPHGSFSRGVAKADTLARARLLREAWSASPVLLAQAYVPTPFDWRIGVLDGSPLFACQYFMVRDHWQILKFSREGRIEEGRGRAVPIAQAPGPVVEAAVAASACVGGGGLHGVDLKVVDGEALVIEVNDNPTIEQDLEASIDPVWERLADYFLTRIERARA